MPFSFGTITPDPPDFTFVPRTRTQYNVVTIPGSGGPVPTTVSAVSIPASSGSSDFLLLTPMAALGWQTTGATTATRTGLVAGDFPLRLVLGFKMPQGNASPTVKLRVTGDSGQQVDKTWAITQTTAGLAKISLILDRSTSMGSSFCGTTTSLAEAVEGVKVALALMANQDLAELIFLDDQLRATVPMGVLGAPNEGGNRDLILNQLSTGVVSAAANIPRAVGLAHVDATAKIVFTDCNTTVPTLPTDPKRFVLAVPNRNTAVYNAVGGGRCLAVTDRITAVGNTRMNVRKLASQILLEATNTAISIDPQWVLGPDDVATLDFTANELDLSMTAIALTDRGTELDLRLVPGHADEPSRQGGGREALRELEVDPEQAYGKKHQPNPHACVRTVVRDNLVHATLHLTPELREETQGKFHVRVKRKPSSDNPRPLPFALTVATDSDLTMNAQLHASSPNVGADLLFSVVVSEAGIPPREARAHVELTYPDGRISRVHLEEGPRGRFNAVLRSMRPGDYFARFLVEGATVLGTPFLREQSRALTLEPAGGCCGGEPSR